MPLNELCEIVLAACYMDVKSLLLLATAKLAAETKGMDEAALRRLYPGSRFTVLLRCLERHPTRTPWD